MTCYLRNGTKARRALPCNHTAIVEGKHTACCDPDDLCLTNGLCRDPAINALTNFVWFFGCTDVTFTDPVCGNYCDKANKGNNHLIFQCPQPQTWCCNTGDVAPEGDRVNRSNTTCCTMSELVFKAQDPVVYTTALNSGISFSIGTLTTASSAATVSVDSRTLSVSSTSINTGSASASSTPPPQTSSSSSSPLAIGLGTGLGGGAVLALGLGWFFLWRRRKRESEVASSEPTSDGRPEMMGQDILETSGKERFEIQDKDPPVEVMGDLYRAELPVERDGENRR